MNMLRALQPNMAADRGNVPVPALKMPLPFAAASDHSADSVRGESLQPVQAGASPDTTTPPVSSTGLSPTSTPDPSNGQPSATAHKLECNSPCLSQHVVAPIFLRKGMAAVIMAAPVMGALAVLGVLCTLALIGAVGERADAHPALPSLVRGQLADNQSNAAAQGTEGPP